DGTPFSVHIEPEGATYEFPPHESVLLTFRQRTAQVQDISLTHHRDALVVWRPGDTEVWATTADGAEQIAGFGDNPFPWLDSNSTADGPPPWDWPPPPPSRTA